MLYLTYGVLDGILSFTVLLCYGGDFGTLPAFAADYYGPGNVSTMYGLMLTARGFAGAFRPTLISRLRETTGDYATALYTNAGMMLVSTLGPFIVRPPRVQVAALATEGEPLQAREIGR